MLQRLISNDLPRNRWLAVLLLAVLLGLALAAFAVGNVAVVMQSGRISDRIGRKPLLACGNADCAR